MKAMQLLDCVEPAPVREIALRNLIREFVDETAYACALIDAEGIIVQANEGVRDLSGFSDSELEGRSFLYGFSGPSTNAETVRKLRRNLLHGVPTGFRMLKYGADGSSFVSGGYFLPFVDEPSGERYACAMERQLGSWREQLFDDPEFQQELLGLLEKSVIG